ncbi:MAG: hypothetical protein KGI97_05855 [Alphaproteobacteria bacterium]|nr:hypothetical protein [Alphaproteobacteria bacterium]
MSRALILILAFLLAAVSPAYAQTNACTAIAANGGVATITLNNTSGVATCYTITNNANQILCAGTGDAQMWTNFYSTPQANVVKTPCPVSCSSPCGTISNGACCTAYASQYPAGACTSQSECCSNGTLSPNNYSYASCTNGCTGTPWGNVSSGYSNTAYSSATPPGPCSSYAQTRTCTNGTMSGSYTATSCTNGCTGTPWGNVPNGYSNTAYASSNPVGTGCTSQTRTCSNGTMSGSYTATSCSPGCSATSDTWANCSGSVGALASGQNENVNNGTSGYNGSATATCSSGSWSYSTGCCQVNTQSFSGVGTGVYCNGAGNKCLYGYGSNPNEAGYNATTTANEFCVTQGDSSSSSIT